MPVVTSSAALPVISNRAARRLLLASQGLSDDPTRRLDDAGLLETGAADLERAAAGATPYLRLFGTVVGGWLLARGALAATRRLSGGGEAEDRPFLEAKVATARFYADNILPRATAEAAAVTRGAASTLALNAAQF